jgi:hypothetical protein
VIGANESHVDSSFFVVLLQVSDGSLQVARGSMTAFAATASICDQLNIQLDTDAGQRFSELVSALLMMQPRALRTHMAAAVLSHVTFDVDLDLSEYDDARSRGGWQKLTIAQLALAL